MTWEVLLAHLLVCFDFSRHILEPLFAQGKEYLVLPRITVFWIVYVHSEKSNLVKKIIITNLEEITLWIYKLVPQTMTYSN